MSPCVPCNRTFNSERALRQHQIDSPKHADIPYKSPGHRQPKEDTVAELSTFISAIDLSPMKPLVPQRMGALHVTNNRLNAQHSPNKALRVHPGARKQPSAPTDQAQTIAQIRQVPIIETPTELNVNVAKRKPENRSSFTFPDLHADIAVAVHAEISSIWFNNDSRNQDSKTEYRTSVMGKFICVNKRCTKHQWTSKLVAIVIRGYSNNGYNATVFNQRCKSCNCLGTLVLDEQSYIERVAYRLKAWAGIIMTPPPYKRGSKDPHEQQFCEGCRMGVCPWANNGLEPLI